MKSITLIALGTLNLLHASMHLLQFIQSMLLISVSSSENHDEHGILSEILHNPILNILWAIIAIVTFYLGIRDFLHHRRCKH